MKKKRGFRLKTSATTSESQSAAPEDSAGLPAPAPDMGQAVRLYTRCPDCKTIYRITLVQMRLGLGVAFCQQCQADFNVLRSLAASPTRAMEDSIQAALPPALGRLEAVDDQQAGNTEPAGQALLESWDEDVGAKTISSYARIAWGVGAAVLLGLFCLQLAWREGPQLAQNPRIRPWLESACHTLGCGLPAFRDLKNIRIVGHDLRPAQGDNYEFILVLANESSLPQVFPSVRLNLAGYDGSGVASRLFQPSDYLKNPGLMEVGKPVEIRLLLVKPQAEIAGFSFELL